MDTISAVVTGARHQRVGKNGQDAAATWVGDGCAAIVVCDGCGTGASSEVGARLGAGLWIRAIARRLESVRAADESIRAPDESIRAPDESSRGSVRTPDVIDWSGVRTDVGSRLGELAAELAGESLRDMFLFTIVSAVVVGDLASVFVLGDGVYSIDGRVRVVGPFADNQPPYLGYDLVGDPRRAHVEVARAREVVVATDGVLDDAANNGDASGRDDHRLGNLAIDLGAVVDAGFVHPDGLRRRLSILARSDERIDWDERRVARSQARLQDDCAIAAIRTAARAERAVANDAFATWRSS
jgi:hypothetical protein